MTLEEFIDSRDDLTFNVQFYAGEWECFVKYVDTRVVFKRGKENIILRKSKNLEQAVRFFIEDISETEFELRHYYDDSKVTKIKLQVPKLDAR